MEGFYDLGEMRWIPGRWTYPRAGSSSASGSGWLEALELIPRLLAVVRSAAGPHVSVPSRELVSPLIRRVGRGPVAVVYVAIVIIRTCIVRVWSVLCSVPLLDMLHQFPEACSSSNGGGSASGDCVPS